MRADQLLVERGLAASRSQAVRLIAGGMRWFDGAQWHSVKKNKDDLPEDAPLELQDDAEARYVSRGGLKLQAALATTGLQVTGLRCLDVGQSTGGFTDCLLQHGAAQVVGVDVGHGQLHARIRDDARVVCIEQINARHLSASDLTASALATLSEATESPHGYSVTEWDGIDFEAEEHAAPSTAEQAPTAEDCFPLIVADLSFISLTLVLPAVVPWLASAGDLLLLVKPQFELQPGQVGKGGIVRDPAMYALVQQRLFECCQNLKLDVKNWFESPIEGGDGNREFFLHAKRQA